MFSTFSIGILLVNLAIAWHVIRTGRTPLWFLAMAIASFTSFLLILGVWLAYLVMAVLPDLFGSAGARGLADSIVKLADPGRAYRRKKRDVERVGSADSKRALAEEAIRQGSYAEAVALYESAMAAPLGDSDPTLLKGLARAKLLSGDAAAAERLLVTLKGLDPAAFDADCELDYARALAETGQAQAAIARYEMVVPRYPGEEARCRFALLLQSQGQDMRAQGLFREILESVKGAPGYYKSRQREWVAIAKANIR